VRASVARHLPNATPTAALDTKDESDSPTASRFMSPPRRPRRRSLTEMPTLWPLSLLLGLLLVFLAAGARRGVAR
jgi:hypothetical protein